MNEKIKNTWEYVKAHKLQIALTAIATVGGVVLFKTLPKKDVVIEDIPVALHNTELTIGVHQFDDHLVEVCYDDIPLSALGELGEEIRKRMPNISEHVGIWALLDPDDVSET